VISGGWNQLHAGSKKQVNVYLSLVKVQLFQDIIYCVFVIDLLEVSIHMLVKKCELFCD